MQPAPATQPAALPTSRRTRYELRDDCGLMDENLDLADFYATNDLEPETVNAIGALEVGQRANVTGGASGIIFVVRVA